MSAVFDGTLLTDFAESFCGYGAYDAPYWFVGMEEACDGSIEGLQRRIAA